MIEHIFYTCHINVSVWSKGRAMGARSDLHFSGLVVAQDLATAACGLFNAAYFVHYWWRRNGSPGRRLGALALAAVSVAAVVEALFSQGLFWWQQGVGPLGELFSPGTWALLRLPLLVATAFITILILRRLHR